jgi:hypothetical protein
LKSPHGSITGAIITPISSPRKNPDHCILANWRVQGPLSRRRDVNSPTRARQAKSALLKRF